jgi:hypothetical protein
VLADPPDDTDAIVEAAVLQRAIDLLHERDKALATMIANGIGGAKSVDGRRTGPNVTSTG